MLKLFPAWLFFLSLPLYAVELLQNVAARPHQSLDGQWRVIVDPFDVGDKRKFHLDAAQKSPSQLLEYNFSTADTLHVPGDWNTQRKDLFFYEGTVWYQRQFNVNVNREKRKTYLLYFEAVNYLAEVYLNGELLGKHEGGFTPFQFDASQQIKNGENSLVVKVNNRRESDNVPPMSTDWWNYGGLTRSVKLVTLEPSYLQDYKFQYVDKPQPAIEVSLQVAGKPLQPGVTLTIPELGLTQTLKLNAQGRASALLPASPSLWSPGRPKLYDIALRYGKQQISDRVGFRNIAVAGRDILLNGQPIFLKGIAIHEEQPHGPGRAWSEAHYRTLLNWALALGCNYVRLAHYPHGETMLRLADELGLLVWAEIPVYWELEFDNEQVYVKAEQQYREMLERDKNRASIILWSVANETLNTAPRNQFLTRLVNKVRELDSSRLVTAALNTQTTTKTGRKILDPFADKVDVIGINTYCGWYEDEAKNCAKYQWESPYNKPIIVSEFGAGALQGYRGASNKIFTEDFQVEVFKHNLAMLSNMSDLRGVSPWLLKDFLSPRRPLANIQDYWNRKGLRSDQGVEKAVWQLMKDWYAQKEVGGK